MKRSEIAISVSLVPVDYSMVVVAGLAAYFVRYWDAIATRRPVVFNLDFATFSSLLWMVAFIWTISFAVAGLYSMQGTRKTIDEFSKIILGCSTAVMILMFVFFFSRNLFDSRFIILAGWLFSIIFVVIGRIIMRFIQHQLYHYQIGVHRVVIIGTGQIAQETIDAFKNNLKTGYRIVDQLLDFSATSQKKLSKMVLEDKFDEILVVSQNLSSKEVNALSDFSYLNHVTLKFIADIFDFPINNFEINTISGLPIVEVKKTRLDGWSKIYKRIFDIIISFVLIIILSPLLIMVMCAIKLDSRGPLFFAYKRIGEYGRPFTYFKFRSMIKDAHAYRYDEKFIKSQQNLREGTPMMKFKDDPRVTRVGKFIRRFSIDELPELFNVFIGKMSLVGPRPHEIEEVEKYHIHHRKVLTIKPGVTGMAQVSGRSDLDFEDEIRLDTWYMENWSLKLDITILLKTPWAVVRKRQAE